MKRLVVVFALVFSFLTVAAQNPMHKEFGTSYADMKTFLETRPGVSAEFLTADKITANTGSLVLTYHFSDAKLYKIEQVKMFDSSKDARETVEGFRTFFTNVQANTLDLSESKEEAHFAALNGRELNEIFQEEVAKKSFQVKTVTMSLEYCPGFEMEALLTGNRKVFNLVASSEN